MVVPNVFALPCQLAVCCGEGFLRQKFEERQKEEVHPKVRFGNARAIEELYHV